jgi:hypothetical protein
VPPIDLAHLDHVVRTDCNAFALRLATSVSSLEQRIANLDVVLAARAVDLKFAALRGFIILAEERHEAHRKTVFAVPDIIGSIDRLACAAAEAGPIFDAHRSEISGSFPPIRQLLREMDAMCSETPASRHLYLSRSHALDDMEGKFHAWSDNTKAFLSDIRRREERLRAAQREQIKRERLEAEAVEKLRKEKAESEAKLKAEEERAKKERERVQAEAAELLRREQVERETRMRVERERTVEATREHAQKGTDPPSSHAFPSIADDTTPIDDSHGVSALIFFFRCNSWPSQVPSIRLSSPPQTWQKFSHTSRRSGGGYNPWVSMMQLGHHVHLFHHFELLDNMCQWPPG